MLEVTLDRLIFIEETRAFSQSSINLFYKWPQRNEISHVSQGGHSKYGMIRKPHHARAEELS